MLGNNRGFRFKNNLIHDELNININWEDLTPREIYKHAVEFRSAYVTLYATMGAPNNPSSPASEDQRLVTSLPQVVYINLAFSNELMLKAIILGGTGKSARGHNIKTLINELNPRYQKIIKDHLVSQGFGDEKWKRILKDSEEIYTKARYGYEDGEYNLHFKAMQHINESLDDIFNFLLPDYRTIENIAETNAKNTDAVIKEHIDWIFSEERRDMLEEIRNE